jgi:uncharacterized protein
MRPRLYLIMFPLVLLLASAICFASDYEDGQAAYNRGDYKTAVALFTKAGNKGDARAQTLLGAMYAYGQGVPQDYKQALLWLRKAADQGCADAQFSLGFIYEQGQGVSQDYNQAASWYRKAADQGDTYAQSTLGDMYSHGQGVPQDYVEAHKWFNLAAASASDKSVRSLAFSRRSFVASQMTPAQIAEAQKRASEWKKK